MTMNVISMPSNSCLDMNDTPNRMSHEPKSQKCQTDSDADECDDPQWQWSLDHRGARADAASWGVTGLFA
jgi:hypothetical protein